MEVMRRVSEGERESQGERGSVKFSWTTLNEAKEG